MSRWWLIAAVALAGLAAGGAGGAPAQDWLRASAQADRTAVPPGGEFRVAVTIDLDPGYHVNSNPPSPKDLVPVVVTPQAAAGIRWGAVHYPPAATYKPAWADEAVSVYTGRAVIQVGGTAAADATPGDVPLRLKLDYQGCREDTCFAPTSRELTAHVQIEPQAAASEEPIHFEGQSNLEELLRKSPLLYFLALFVGGLLLDLTPCVFPLVPVTMSIFAQQSDRRGGKIFLLAALYVLGLATTFAAVGVVAALTGQSLGFILQRPAGALAVIVVLAVMMASLFGAFEIQLPAALAGRLSARKGLLGAVFMGAVMGAIAAPCVGPFLISEITIIAKTAAAPGTSTAYAIVFGAGSFFVTGLGLGAPFLALGLFTGLISRYPRSGGWLVWVKSLMGFALAGLILYYAQPYIAAAFFWLVVLATAVLAAVYLGVLEGWSRRPFKRWFWTVRLVTAAAVLAAGVALYMKEAPASPDSAAAPAGGQPVQKAAGAEIKWTPWTEGSLEAAATAGKPVLLYFGADWCIACKEWHAGLFSDPDVRMRTEGFERIFVDLTRAPEGKKRDMALRFDAINPPAVILLDGRGKVAKAYRNPPSVKEFTSELTQVSFDLKVQFDKSADSAIDYVTKHFNEGGGLWSTSTGP
jgi:thiol:disulfide interchange protein DsbD